MNTRRTKSSWFAFAGRYKAFVVEGGGNGYLRTVCDYVHLNPVRAKLLPPDVPLQSYPWSSYGHYLKPAGQCLAWLRVDRLLGEKGIPGDTEAGRQEFGAQMERHRAEEAAANYDPVRQDWILGSEEFRQELPAAVAGQAGPSHYGAQRRETAAQKAERILREGLAQLRWTEAQLLTRRKGDRGKVVLAHRLRQETTMSLKWIAQRLHMGSWTYVSNLLNPKASAAPPEPMLPLFQ